MWDRNLVKRAKYSPVRGYKHVFVGHTPVQTLARENGAPVTYPITWNNVTACDCGAGGSGRLAIVNVDNPALDFYLSDFQTMHVDPYESDPLFTFGGVDSDGADDTEELAWGKMVFTKKDRMI